MKTLLLLLVCLLTGNLLFAQRTKFVTAGTIDFEKRVNVFASSLQEIGRAPNNLQAQMLEQYKRTQPQFKVLKSTFLFNGNKTLYKPVPSPENTTSLFENPMAKQFNIVYTDLSTSSRVAQKVIYGDQILLKDSLNKIKWKITDETRDIAGYPCRRANALILDSVYVVAFYTDKIRIKGGPESFAGLPGMILEVAVPHEHATWTAVKVTETPPPANAIVPPTKGKVTTNKELYDKLKQAMKNWGAAGPFELRVYML
jgi:GLPGLI family protein